MFGKLIDKLKAKPNTVEKEDFYGGNGTIHQTGTIDVQMDKHGHVVAVWFRCRMLPFTQSIRDYGDVGFPSPEELGSIKGIVFEGDE